MKVFPYGPTLSLVLPLLLLKAQRSEAQAAGGVVGGTAADGGVLSLACPDGEILGNVLFASYGLPTGSFPKFARGSCNADLSNAVVKAQCIGAQSCELTADASVFGDPCVDQAKHLSVAVQCVNENVIGGSAGEDSLLRLRCPVDRVIGDVTFASFGTPQGHFLNYTVGSCDQPTSAATVSDICAGREACDIMASSTVFGDPCPGESKYLGVQVNCVDPDAAQGTAQDGSSLALACPWGASMASIDFASYGTPKNYVEGTCSAATSSGVVAAACVGRPACNVAVNPSVFGDPCPGTVKTLSARAMCTPNLTPGFIQSMGPQGGSTVVTCPRGDVISDIPFASYGTPSGLAAPSQCHAASSESIVRAKCIGKRTCTVDATNGIFGDPCPGFTKSLFIAAQCSSANLVGGSVPDGSTLTIACPLTQRLVSIPYASYGTPTGTYPNFVTTWCNATDTATVVTTACVGRNACSVKADSNEFGDPCPGVTKQLSVVAKCVDNNLIGGSVADGGSAAIQCPAGQYIGSIPFAAYGTPYGTFPDYSAHAACNAEGAAAKIASQCVGRNSCAVSVSTQTFGDPCEGEAKTLDWTAKCAPNNVIGTIVNDGGSATLQCPLGHYMSAINFASYGTPGGNFPDYAIDTTCHAASSTSIATSACVGKSTCTLLASTGSFSDPCPTVAKSLAVSADCISNLVIGGTAAQNTMMNLACPKGATVRSIDFASYGTPTGKLGAFALSACHDPNSVRIVQQACLGKTGCSISASNSVFVNNCRRTQMYLAVQATCATPTPATTALRTPTPS